MKADIIIILCVFIIDKVYSEKIVSYKQDNINNRQKRQFTDYDWDYMYWDSQPSDMVQDNNFMKIIQSTTPEPDTGFYKPCDPYLPNRPDFSYPNRRISEVKCYEYKWDLKTRIEKDKRTQECYLENKRKKGGFAILDGRDTDIGEFPHMAAIGWKTRLEGPWIFKCCGSLISSNVVLTAGHCTKASPYDTSIADTIPKIVRLGDKILESNIRYKLADVNISAILRHPLYKAPKKYNDIAIMTLEKHVVFSVHVHPACLWPYFDTKILGTQATATGWGVVKSGNLKTPPNMQAAVVDLIPSHQCNNLLERYCNRHWCGLENHQLCAGTLAGGADSCQGDSGGPLQVQIPNIHSGHMHYVIGVTSFGIHCGRPNSPGVYSRVSSYVDWIESVVWPLEFNRYSLRNTYDYSDY